MEAAAYLRALGMGKTAELMAGFHRGAPELTRAECLIK